MRPETNPLRFYPSDDEADLLGWARGHVIEEDDTPAALKKIELRKNVFTEAWDNLYKSNCLDPELLKNQLVYNRLSRLLNYIEVLKLAASTIAESVEGNALKQLDPDFTADSSPLSQIANNCIEQIEQYLKGQD